MKQCARWNLTARAKPFPRQEDGEPPLIQLRCGGAEYLLTIDEGRKLADELDEAIDIAEAPDTERRPETTC
jgi:hypothetical protein